MAKSGFLLVPQLLGSDDLPVERDKHRSFSMIENYVYLYHTDTLIALPVYPESITDTMSIRFSETTPLSRSAPIYSYSSSGPRTFQVQLPLHRDLMNQVNIKTESFIYKNIGVDIYKDDYVEILVKQLQSAALPSYAASEKMVNPPIVAVRFGNSLFCKGVITDGVTVEHSGPILPNNKYAMQTVSFTVSEIDPYDAEYVALVGGFRGLNTTLERNLYKTGR